jgi:antitoxin VapB
MALSIKDPEADRLVRELAAATGESITEAARKAFEERLERVRAHEDGRAEGDRAWLREVMRRARAGSALDDRSADEILGYDERGLPS